MYVVVTGSVGAWDRIDLRLDFLSNRQFATDGEISKRYLDNYFW